VCLLSTLELACAGTRMSRASAGRLIPNPLALLCALQEGVDELADNANQGVKWVPAAAAAAAAYACIACSCVGHRSACGQACSRRRHHRACGSSHIRGASGGVLCGPQEGNQVMMLPCGPQEDQRPGQPGPG